MTWTCCLDRPEVTRALGRALASCAMGGEVVGLRGGLGAGKTCFAQGVGEGLGVAGPVTSPTFVLVNEYPAPLPLLHADLYRLEAGELEGVGLEEQLETWPGVALVEWAERFPDVLPLDHLELHLELLPSDGALTPRQATLSASGPRSQRQLEEWRERFEDRDAS